YHSLVSPDSDEYEVSFPSLPPRKELSTPKVLKKQAIDPPSHRSIIEEALRIHDNLEALIRDNPLEVKLSEVFRAEKKSLEADIEAYSICPDSLLFEKIEAIDARNQKIKELTLEVETETLKTLGSEAKFGTTRVEAKGNTPTTEYIEEVVSEAGTEVPGTDVSPGVNGFNSTVTVSKVSAPVYGPNGLAIVESCETGVICMNYEGEGKQLGEFPSDRSLAHQVLDNMAELNSVKVRGEEESSLELEGSEQEIESGEESSESQGNAVSSFRDSSITGLFVPESDCVIDAHFGIGLDFVDVEKLDDSANQGKQSVGLENQWNLAHQAPCSESVLVVGGDSKGSPGSQTGGKLEEHKASVQPNVLRLLRRTPNQNWSGFA
ncbi:hypothetical protein U1Q18_017890, partial [Sarracenia purpurea var. burkii]